MAQEKKRKKWDREARRALDASVAAVNRAKPERVVKVLKAEIEENLAPLILARKLRKGDTKAELLEAASHAIEDAEDEAWLLAEIKEAMASGLEGARLAKEPLAVAEALNARFGPFAVWQERLYRCQDGLWSHITTRKTTGLVYELSRERAGFTASPHASKGVLEALSSAVAFNVDEQPPVWLEEPTASSEAGTLPISAQSILGAPGGLLVDEPEAPLLITGGPAWHVLAPNACIDPVTKRTFRPTKSLFHPFPLGVPYDKSAPKPETWLAFLKGTGIGPQDTKMLQEYMGYCCTGATEMQKFLMIRGGPGTGKGTLATVCRAIYGEGYTASTLEQLGTQFGLAKLARKSVAVIGDAHLRQRGDQTSILDRFLSITGGDDLPVDQKFKDEVDALFTLRFIMLTNQLPRFHDASAAFARRCLAMEFHNAPEEPDPTLPSRLVAEAPGILRWALNGLARLVRQGYFTQSEKSKAIVNEMINLTSPIRPFLDECCKMKGRVECTLLYEKYKDWADVNGYQAMNSSAFGRLLREAVPGVTKSRPAPRTSNSARPYYYEGIGLRRGA